MSGIARSIGILVTGIAAGASITWAIGLSASESVALASVLDVHRDTWNSQALAVIALETIGLLVAVVAAIALREKPMPQRAAGLASLGLVIALLLGFLFVGPIAAEIAAWSAAEAPEDASVQIHLLARLLFARTTFEALAAAAFVCSVLADRPIRRSYTSIRPEVDEPQPPIFVPERGLSSRRA